MENWRGIALQPERSAGTLGATSLWDDDDVATDHVEEPRDVEKKGCVEKMGYGCGRVQAEQSGVTLGITNPWDDDDICRVRVEESRDVERKGCVEKLVSGWDRGDIMDHDMLRHTVDTTIYPRWSHEKKGCGKTFCISSILVVVMVILGFGQQMYFHYQFSSLEGKMTELGGKKKGAYKTRNHQPSPQLQPINEPIKEQPVSWNLDVGRVRDYYLDMQKWVPQPTWITKFGSKVKIQGITMDDIKSGFIPEMRYPWVLVGRLGKIAEKQEFDFWPLDDFAKKIGESWEHPDEVYSIILSVPQVLKDWLLIHKIRKQPPCKNFKDSLPELFTALIVPPGRPGGQLQPFHDMSVLLDNYVNDSRGDASFVQQLIVGEDTSIVDFTECLLRLDQAYSVWPVDTRNQINVPVIMTDEIKNKSNLLAWAKSDQVALVGRINWASLVTPIKLEWKTRKKLFELLNKAATEPKNHIPMIVLMRFDHGFISKMTEAFIEMQQDMNVLNDLKDVIVKDCYYISLILPDATDEKVKCQIKRHFRRMASEIDEAAGPLVRVTWADVDAKYDDNIEFLRRAAEMVADVDSFEKKKAFKFAAQFLLGVVGTVATNSGMPAGALVGNLANTVGTFVAPVVA